MKHVLILLTNHATLGDTDDKNGTYAPELTNALHVFQAAGYDYSLASIEGGEAPLYGTEDDDEVNQEVLANSHFQQKIKETLPISSIEPQGASYSAVFYPGGFGLLSDLAHNAKAAAITAALYEQGAVVGAVCHGPAGLLPVELANGKALLHDKIVTGFTYEEEKDFGTLEKIPFLLEEALTRKAAGYHKVAPWQAFIVEQDRLITGQNPASAKAVGEAMVRRLEA